LVAAGTGRAESAQQVPFVCEKEPRCFEQVQRAIEQAKTNREAALSTIQDAYQQYPDPRLCYNLGRLLQQLKRPAEAAAQYRRFLEAGVENRPEVIVKARTYLEQMEREALPPSVVPAQSVTQPALTETKPIYKKWWFWTAIAGGTAAVAIGVGLGVGLTSQPSNPQIPAGVIVIPASF